MTVVGVLVRETVVVPPARITRIYGALYDAYACGDTVTETWLPGMKIFNTPTEFFSHEALRIRSSVRKCNQKFSRGGGWKSTAPYVCFVGGWKSTPLCMLGGGWKSTPPMYACWGEGVGGNQPPPLKVQSGSVLALTILLTIDLTLSLLNYR